MSLHASGKRCGYEREGIADKVRFWEGSIGSVRMVGKPEMIHLAV
jgi:hypothetical protein